MLKFDEEKQIASVQGALALRGRIEAIVDDICRAGFKNICWLGIGGTYASCLQAEVHMKERSRLEFFVEKAAEYLTTGNRRVGEGTVVVISSVTGSTIEMVDAVKKAQTDGARVLGFIDVETTELAKRMDWEIAYPANEQLKFFMVADRLMFRHGEFPEYEEYYAQLDAHLAVDLAEVARSTLRLLSPLAAKLGVSLRCEPEAGCIISAPEDDVYQIIFNLAENAVKYNVEGGSVDISVRREGGRVLLIVEDRGIGIPEADLPNIFSRFYRVDKARSREKGGSGLGLSIVHDAVSALGGSIEVEAREGGGTRFTVSFPEPGEGEGA